MTRFIYLILLLLTASCATASVENTTDDFPTGEGDFTFHIAENSLPDSLQVFYYIPSGYDRTKMPVVVGFHGNDRDCSYWIDTWKEYAREKGFMFFIPWFTREDFPTRLYQETGVRDTEGNLVAPGDRTSAMVDSLIHHILKYSGTDDEKAIIYGHSAGGQFVHRFMLLNDSPYVKKAIIGNPGWFTFPDRNEDFPYGIKDLKEIDDSRIRDMLGKNIILQLAEGDTLRESFLRKTPEADRQGLNRLQRGNRFFDTLAETAKSNNWDFNWRRVYVADTGHDAVAMSRHAATHLVNDSILIPIRGEEPVKVSSDWLHRYDDEVEALSHKSDQDKDTVCDAVFVGSSSIRLWHDLEKAMSPMIVKNRGYGGAMMRDLGINYHRVMAHYRPKAIVFYCDNDICGWKEGDLSAAQLFSMYKSFIETLNKDYPGTMVYFLSIKHSLQRRNLRKQQEEVNSLMQKYAEGNERLTYVDVASLLLDKNGQVNDSLFMEDHLHLNPSGYKLWNDRLKPLLLQQTDR